MRIETQPAYLLHARPYRETSLLLDAFTRDHGRVGLVARGVRRERSRLPRGLLQPLQPLVLDWVAKGELGTLTGAEAAGMPLPLAGEALFPAMYLNELVLRLSARNDPHPEAFGAYALCLSRLAGEPNPAWALRRFERDFLAGIGYALALDRTAAGDPVEAAADYAYDPDSGPLPGDARSHWPRISGAALLALAGEDCPPPAQLRELRALARAVIRHVAGGELASWTLGRGLTAVPPPG